jgi:hypothetical protein
MGTTVLKQRRKKLQEQLSDIGPGFLLDRTDRVLLKKDNDDNDIIDNQQIRAKAS